MNEAQVKHFIVMERQKGTTIEELIFILHSDVEPISPLLTSPITTISFS